MNRAVVLIVALCAGAGSAPAQTRASIGVGIGTVRTETGSAFSSASLSPSLRYSTPSFATHISGSVASLPDGIWSGHGRLGLSGVTRRVTGPLRLGAEGDLAGTTRTGGEWTAAAHGLGELMWSGRRWGVGLGAGPSAGWIANEPSVVALHTRGRAWWRPGGPGSPMSWQLSIEPTRFFGEWFTEVSLGTTMRRGWATMSVSADTRMSSAYGSTAAGSVFLQVFLTDAMALELGGGSYLREPYQGFPRGNFLRVGVRMGSMRSARPASVQTVRPLVPRRSGDTVVVQFQFSDVRTVAIAGDWDDWQTHSLHHLGGDRWEGRFALRPGVYHFNLLVDGRSWVVPGGVKTIPDGLGGIVAVLLVRP